MDPAHRSLLLGDGLELPPDDATEAEYYKLAVKAAEGDAPCYLIRKAKTQLHKEALKLKAGLRGSRYQEPKDKLLCELSENDSDEDDDEEYARLKRLQDSEEPGGPGTGLTRAEYKATLSQLRYYDQEIIELRRAEETYKTEYINAHRMVRDHTHVSWSTKERHAEMRKTILMEAPVCTDMKRMILRLALQVDREATEAVEALGYWYVRTPAFYYENGLTDFSERLLCSDFKLGDRQKGTLPMLPYDLEETPESQAHQFLPYIDSKVESASYQDDVAICEILALLGSSKVPDVAIEHAKRTIAERNMHVKELDSQAKFEPWSESDVDCSMLALWPCGPDDANAKGYSLINKHVQSFLYSGEENLEMVEWKQKIESIKTRFNMPIATDEEKIEAIKQNIFMHFNQLKKADPLLHLTPLVITVLLKIAGVGLNEVRRILYDLYLHEDGEPKHWMTRRQAATEICEMCKDKNEFARKVLLDFLLFDSHWMIRQMSISELAQVIGTLPDNHERLHSFVNIFVNQCFYRDNLDGKGEEPTEDVLRERKLVQHAAHMALVKELPYYSDKTRDIVLAACRHQVAWEPAINKPFLDNIMSELGRLFPETAKASSGGYAPDKSKYKSAGRDTLRQARKAQQAMHMYEI